MRLRVMSTVGLVLCVLVGCGGGSDGTIPSGDGLTFQAASFVIGQPSFTTMDADRGNPTPGANGLTNPNGVTVSASFTLVTDWGNSRILGFTGPVQSMDPTATFVIGQNDFAGEQPSLDNDRLDDPRSAYLDGSRLLVADDGNHRVLIWTTVPQANEGADYVLGQVDFHSKVAASGPQGMNHPNDVLVAGGRLFVADGANNRVLVWNAVPTASNVAADYVLGQPDLLSNASTTTASGMDFPLAMWSDGTRLVVADAGNGRVLIWTSLPTATGQPADVVVGQPDFVTAVKGSGPDGLSGAGGVTSDGTRLFVTDNNANRILVFDPFPTANGPAAVEVIGQSDFMHSQGNDDNQDGANDGAPSARTLYGPARTWIHDGYLYVADILNHRVVVHALD